MKFGKTALALFASLMLSAPSASLAQETAAEGDAAPAASAPPSQNWLKVCEPLDNGERACIMRQIILQNGQFIGSFVLRDDPGSENRLLAIAAVPLGVLLPFGLTWQIDSTQPVRVPYMLCDPQSCLAQLVVNEAYVNALKRGATLKLTAKNRRNQDLVVEINLGGFTATYEAEDAMTVDEVNAADSGNTALEQMLQDRAEELRQQMGVEGDGTEGQ